MTLQFEDLDPDQPVLARKIGHPFLVCVFDRADPGGGLVLVKDADTKEQALEMMRWCLVLFDQHARYNFWIMEDPQGPGQTWTNVWAQHAMSMGTPERSEAQGSGVGVPLSEGGRAIPGTGPRSATARGVSSGERSTRRIWTPTESVPNRRNRTPDGDAGPSGANQHLQHWPGGLFARACDPWHSEEGSCLDVPLPAKLHVPRNDLAAGSPDP